MTTFETWANSIRRWPWNLVGLVIILGLTVISLGLFYEDFTTSLEGYKLWPTRKANLWVIVLVAALPQLGQIGTAYAFLGYRRIPAIFFAMLGFMAWDVFMDIYYKSYQFSTIELSAAATFESVLLYTLGSEMLLAFSIGMLFQVIPSILEDTRTYRPRTRSKPAPTYTPKSQQVKIPPKPKV